MLLLKELLAQYQNVFCNNSMLCVVDLLNISNFPCYTAHCRVQAKELPMPRVGDQNLPGSL